MRSVLAFAALLVLGSSASAQYALGGSKVSELPFASLPLSGNELIYVVQNGASRQATAGDFLKSNLGTATKNTVFAGPPSGLPAVGGFRALVLGDLPSTAGSYIPLVTGGADNAPAINAAITVQAAFGGGVVYLACGGTQTTPYYFSQIVLKSNVYVVGCGEQATYLMQLAGQNKAAVIGPSNFSSLVGTDTPNGGAYPPAVGLEYFGVSRLTIDGNISNNATGDCLDIYGRYPKFEQIKLTNCAGNGMWTEWGNGYTGPPTTPATQDNGLEGYFQDVHIWDVNREGVHFNGPHDSYFSGLVIAGASQGASNTYAGLYIGPQGNARWVNLHQYMLSTTGAKCGVDLESTGNNFSASHFEGSYTPLYIGNGTDCYGNSVSGTFGSNNFDASNQYYGGTTAGGPQIVVHSPFNLIQGLISCPTGMQGIKLGTSGDNPTSNRIDLIAVNCTAGSIVFNEPVGFSAANEINLVGYEVTGPGYVNSPNSGDNISLHVGAATSNGDLNQRGLGYLSPLTVGGPAYGTASLSMTCAGSSTTCYLSSVNSSGSGADPTTTFVTANGAGTVGRQVAGAGVISDSINSVTVNSWSSTAGAAGVPYGWKVYTIATLPTCNSGAKGYHVYVSDTVSNAAAAWHGTPTGGGATTVNASASCNGSNWQYE